MLGRAFEMNHVLSVFLYTYTEPFVALYFVIDYGFQNLLIKRDIHVKEGKAKDRIINHAVTYYEEIIFGFAFLLDCIRSQNFRISKRENKLIERLTKFFHYLDEGQYKTMYLNNQKFIQSINYDIVKIRSLEEIRNCDVKSLLIDLHSKLDKEEFEEICKCFIHVVNSYKHQFDWKAEKLEDAVKFTYQILGI